eukprot:CAMPEP_0176247278 /NCGR_PEP_ID=MMETSP0121_2-20121125/32873_1 /TAXON_ID=160619 /ORGANISM="Kryptoperidinium foliaceum, Strain CCMP 1326" /LENGTH=151 /DNA_ID=CAMNT_0017586929 /DNA_START=105 /DNA_END=556 /DNA_ORIENTATION=-
MKLQRRPRVHFEALLLVVLLVALNADAFMASTKSIGWGQYYQSVSPRQSILRPLQAVAKSGGKMIVTEEMYTQTVLSKDVKRPVLVFFSAPWCGRLTNPVVKEVMKQYAGEIDVVEVCTDDLAEVAEQAGIVSIPTIQFYYGGQNLETIVG